MDTKDIQKLGELAKIEIKPEEAEGFKKDFESILGYIKQIESVDISDLNSEYITKNVARPDEVKNSPGIFRDDILSSAPDKTDDGYIKVNKIL